MMEIHKEVGNALRERSLIGNVFNKIESATKIKRMVIIYGECYPAHRCLDELLVPRACVDPVDVDIGDRRRLPRRSGF
ncbi:hypothetical protein IscW_ISCW014830 [Ixodes scapularis]|uniref:Uncharacterized protein n=1 Tax=Ixodes scapularis TaxID=6945 RepID=B7QKJ3_IXOSC|nr:hypothetical protein IscW_ISCW014830 [Ixodes scapularis]|eukprot:XP_002415698.1 hypothetical protein IscW_ISCW014830 [Ixodes scapularis]